MQTNDLDLTDMKLIRGKTEETQIYICKDTQANTDENIS